MLRTFAHPALIGIGMLLACAATSCSVEPVGQSRPQPAETVTVTAGEAMPSPAVPAPQTTPAEASTRLLDNSVTIAEVVDGDTVRYSVGPRSVTARVLGIDAPETGTCAGAEATDWAMSTLLGSTVRVHYDDSQQPSDRYGRELVYLTLSDGRDYSTETAREGHAEYYDVGVPVIKASAIRSAETQARNAERGLWGECQDGANEPAPQQLPPVPPAGGDEPATRTTETTRTSTETTPETTTTGPTTTETTTPPERTTTTETTTESPVTTQPAAPEGTTP